MHGDVTLTLFIPELFTLQPALSQIPGNEIPELPVLEQWLSRGVSETSTVVNDPELHDIVFAELGITLEIPTASKPLSAFSLLAETSDVINNDVLAEPLSAYWLRADPVCIQPDRDTAVVMAYEELALSQDEANKLVADINSHFVDEPWELHAVHPHRWYLKHEHVQDLNTSALKQAIGQDINPYLPQGNDANYWLQCTNEIQMLLHGTSINFERESRGQWTVNSLWLWGGGVLPENKTLKTAHAKIISNDIVLQGIGRYYDIDVFSFDDDYLQHIQSGNSFMLIDTLAEAVSRRDVYAYIQNLVHIEEHYLKNIADLLKQGKIKQVRLLSEKRTITVNSKLLRRWWKRHKSFSEY